MSECSSDSYAEHLCSRSGPGDAAPAESGVKSTGILAGAGSGEGVKKKQEGAMGRDLVRIQLESMRDQLGRALGAKPLKVTGSGLHSKGVRCAGVNNSSKHFTKHPSNCIDNLPQEAKSTWIGYWEWMVGKKKPAECAVLGCENPADRGNHVWIYRQGVDDPNAELRDSTHCWIFAGCALHNGKSYDLKPLGSNKVLTQGSVYYHHGQRVQVVAVIDERNQEYLVKQVSKPYAEYNVSAKEVDATVWMQLKPNAWLAPAPATPAMFE